MTKSKESQNSKSKNEKRVLLKKDGTPDKRANNAKNAQHARDTLTQYIKEGKEKLKTSKRMNKNCVKFEESENESKSDSESGVFEPSPEPPPIKKRPKRKKTKKIIYRPPESSSEQSSEDSSSESDSESEDSSSEICYVIKQTKGGSSGRKKKISTTKKKKPPPNYENELLELRREIKSYKEQANKKNDSDQIRAIRKQFLLNL